MPIYHIYNIISSNFTREKLYTYYTIRTNLYSNKFCVLRSLFCAARLSFQQFENSTIKELTRNNISFHSHMEKKTVKKLIFKLLHFKRHLFKGVASLLMQPRFAVIILYIYYNNKIGDTTQK